MRPAGLLLGLVLALAAPRRGSACARLTFTTADNVTLTGRIMDGTGTQHESLWVLPPGVARLAAAPPANGSAAPDGAAAASAAANASAAGWVSKYAVVAMVGGNMSLPDGMNEKGLVINHSRMVRCAPAGAGLALGWCWVAGRRGSGRCGASRLAG